MSQTRTRMSPDSRREQLLELGVRLLATRSIEDLSIDMLAEASNIVWEEQAAGYIVFRQDINGSRKTLHNYLPNGYSQLWGISFYWTEVQ